MNVMRAKRIVALVLAAWHFGASATQLNCDPALDGAIEQRRGASDRQIDGVDGDISADGQRMIECMIDFADVAGNSITVGGYSVDIRDLVDKLNREACNMTKDASKGRLPSFPDVGRMSARSRPAQTAKSSNGAAAVVERSSGGASGSVWDALSGSFGGVQ